MGPGVGRASVLLRCAAGELPGDTVVPGPDFEQPAEQLPHQEPSPPGRRTRCHGECAYGPRSGPPRTSRAQAALWRQPHPVRAVTWTQVVLHRGHGCGVRPAAPGCRAGRRAPGATAPCRRRASHRMRRDSRSATRATTSVSIGSDFPHSRAERRARAPQRNSTRAGQGEFSGCGGLATAPSAGLLDRRRRSLGEDSSADLTYRTHSLPRCRRDALTRVDGHRYASSGGRRHGLFRQFLDAGRRHRPGCQWQRRSPVPVRRPEHLGHHQNGRLVRDLRRRRDDHGSHGHHQLRLPPEHQALGDQGRQQGRLLTRQQARRGHDRLGKLPPGQVVRGGRAHHGLGQAK